MSSRRTLFGAVLLFAILVTPAQAVEVLSGPTIVMDPTGQTPLAGQFSIRLDQAVRIRLTITSQGESRVVDFPEVALIHVVPLLGLKPDRDYTVDVDLIPGGPAGSLLVTTPALPADFPTLVTHVSVPESMEPGYTLLDCFFRERTDTRISYTIIVDAAGEVVWYSTNCPRAAKQLPNGDLFFQSNNSALRMDMLGRTKTTPLQIVGTRLHHDLQLTPHGTMLSLTYLAVDVPDFPTSDTDPNAPRETTSVRDEPVLEFFPDGTLRRQWLLSEMIDPTRIAFDSLQTTTTGVDWVHTNAVTYRPEDDSIIVSARHQDAVISFSRETGQLRWILGNHENWSGPYQPFLLNSVGSPFRWQFHQHAPMWTDNGTLLLFDNGNFRASPFDGTTPETDTESFSRAVEYEIDADLMQVRQLWEFGEFTTERLYSFFISDADSQPLTGNRLITFGGIEHVDGVPSIDLGLGKTHTRVIETTDDLSATTVFDLTVYDPTGGRLATYRSERIPDLYPSQQVLPPNGVGNTLRLERAPGGSDLNWLVSPDDSGHTAADYYIVYGSDNASSGFAILESTASVAFASADGESTLEFYKIVAANSAGTSGDEPSPAVAAD